MLRPEQKLSPVAVAIGGKIDYVNLEEDALVCAGDTLLILSRQELLPETDHLSSQLRERRLLLRDLEQLTALPSAGAELPALASAVYQRDYQDYRRRRDEAALKLAHAKRHLQRQTQLIETLTISRMEFEQAEFEHRLASSQYDQLAKQQRHLWTQELQRVRREARDLANQIERVEERATQYVVTAPTDGSLTQTVGLQPGAYIAPGQTIAQVSPEGNLRVETYVSPSDIGLLREGMHVNLQLDAFNHHQWGLAKARVATIGKDVTEFEGGMAFRVVCDLQTKELYLRSGYAGRLRKGMTATAHFELTCRSLFDLLHDKLDDWFAPQYYQAS